MRKTIVRAAAAVLLLCLSVLPAAGEGLSRDTWYALGIDALEEMTTDAMTEAVEYFSAAGNYEQALNLRTYARSLSSVITISDEAANLDLIIFQLSDLAKQEKLVEELEAHGLPSCESLITYTEAYRMQQNGEYIGARERFASVRSILDAQDRMYELTPKAYEQAKALYDQADYEAAAAALADLDWGDSAELYQSAFDNLPHMWKEADCLHPRTCTIHNETEGDPLGHDWEDATCEKPRTCRRCGATEGSPADHVWLEATYARPKTCAVCGATEGTPKEIMIGAAVLFGAYEQDNVADNGPEPIEWTVLDVQKGKALLLSRYALDAKPYYTENKSITWEDSTLRYWLNGEFLNAAFSDGERAAILLSQVDNSAAQGNKGYSTKGGNDTQDRVFLLSYHEVFDVYFSSEKARMCAPTDYAVANGTKRSNNSRTEGRAAGAWWLRSPGYIQNIAADVLARGAGSGDRVYNSNVGVRPALWLNLEADFSFR